MRKAAQNVIRSLVLATITLPALATMASAQGTDPLRAAVDARQSHMALYQFNLMTLGGMAQGNLPYDATAAGAAADNLLALSTLDQSGYWAEGTAAGAFEGSRANPAIWENPDDFAARGAALTEALTQLAAVADTDLDALRGAMGDLGRTCGACHQTYRAN